MRSLGWIENETFSIEERFANGNLAPLAADADELAAANVDVIVAISDKAARSAHQVLRRSIVFTSGNPIGSGLFTSFARPRGNATGLSLMWPDIVARQLEILKQAVPPIKPPPDFFRPSPRFSDSSDPIVTVEGAPQCR